MPEIVTHLKLLLWQRQRVGIKFSGCAGEKMTSYLNSTLNANLRDSVSVS